jgi:hypothetical protein
MVLSAKKDERKTGLAIAILIFGFLYFFAKNIVNLILNIDLLGTENYQNPIVVIFQFAWFFPSIMFFIANTYFALGYVMPKSKS